MVREDLKPSDILTLDAFHNAIVVNSAIGGSTNAPIHLAAIARHIGVDLPLRATGAAAGQPATGGRISGRGLLPRGRRARRGRQLIGQGLIREAR
jgi:dihydroxy-acid dehydratase